MTTFTKMSFRALLMVLLLQTVSADPLNRTPSADQLQQQCATLLEMNKIFFLLDETWNISGVPADMHIHWKTGDIYFTLLNLKYPLSVHVINKETGLQNKINITGGQSTVIDNTNNIIYFATDNGVYKQKDDGSTELYAASGEDVMYATVTRDGSVMYIATHPENDVHKITQNGKTMEDVSEIGNGHGITVDHKGNIFFQDLMYPYVLQAGKTVPVRIEGLPGDNTHDFCVIKAGDEVFAMAEDSILYIVDGESATATRWGSFNLSIVNAFAMDEFNNVYIGVEGAIKKFKHYYDNPCKV